MGHTHALTHYHTQMDIGNSVSPPAPPISWRGHKKAKRNSLINRQIDSNLSNEKFKKGSMERKLTILELVIVNPVLSSLVIIGLLAW